MHREFRLDVTDRQVVNVPVDSEVVRISARIGSVFIKISLGKSEELVERYFYVLNGDQIMEYPNFLILGSVSIGGTLYHVCEDDLCTS